MYTTLIKTESSIDLWEKPEMFSKNFENMFI